MELPNPDKCAEIWARVYSQPDSICSLAAQIAKWTLTCDRNSMAYYYLARLLPRQGAALRRLAQRCAGQTVALAALYHVMTGQRITRPAAVCPTETEAAPLVSTLYRHETETARQMLTVPREQEASLHRLAQEQLERAADLLTLTAPYL